MAMAPNTLLGYPPELDAQHAKLFELCTQLKQEALTPYSADFHTDSGVYRAVVNPDTSYRTPNPRALTVASELIVYTMNHFAWEEALLEATATKIESNHPQFAGEFGAHHTHHLREHRSLEHHSVLYKAEFELHAVTALSLYVFVRHWLIAHIGRTDRWLSYWCRVADGLPAELPPT